MKTLEEFDFSAASHILAKQIRALAEDSYLERADTPLHDDGKPFTISASAI